jgi:hypothetical protein
MARYRVQGPDGKVHVFEGPDGATPADVEAFAAATFGKAKEPPPIQGGVDPTAGMSTLEKGLAGVGSGMTSVVRALGGGRAAQALGLPGTKEEAERLDAPLANTTAGKVGQVIGVAAPAALAVPFTPLTYGGAAAAGALTGGAMTEGDLGDRAAGAGMGAAGGVIGQALPAVYRTGKAVLKGLAEPLLRGGQERIAGRTLQRFLTDENALQGLTNAPSLTGARPTLAEAARDPGLATLERAIGQVDPQAAVQLSERAAQNNAARIATLQGIAGDPAKRAQAEAWRTATAEPIYAIADSAVVSVDDAFRGLAQRPAFAKAIKDAETLARNEGLADLFFRGPNGQPMAITGQGAHYIKKALDDMGERGSSSYMGEAAARSAGKTQQTFLEWLDKTVPEYAAAKKAFAAESKPINQMDVGQRLLDKTTGATRDFAGNRRFQANAFAKAMNDEEALIKAATGQRTNALTDVMTPDQMARLGAVRNELETLANLSNAANGPGSQTAKALASQNLLRQIAGPTGMPLSWVESTAAQSALRPVQWGMNAAEPRIQEAIARGLLDPEEALRMISAARAADAVRPANALQLLTRRSAPAAIGGLSAYGAGQ